MQRDPGSRTISSVTVLGGTLYTSEDTVVDGMKENDDFHPRDTWSRALSGCDFDVETVLEVSSRPPR